LSLFSNDVVRSPARSSATERMALALCSYERGCRFCEPIPLGQPVQACDESIHVCSRELELAPSGSRPLALSTLCLQLVLCTGHQANPARFLATEWMAGVDSGQGHESLARSKRTVAKCACFTIDVSIRPDVTTQKLLKGCS